MDQSIEATKKMIDERPLQYWNYMPLIDSYIKVGDYANALFILNERYINFLQVMRCFRRKSLSLSTINVILRFYRSSMPASKVEPEISLCCRNNIAIS